ncbi:MAG: F0F1 ATP synthase subunit gamma [Pseudomonadota bacterium]|nr:F0F1 ATP synthase subunit gamma [Pseudomonadota bacterium]
MRDGSAALCARIASAALLQAMARTMKTIAASNIGQYEAAARALDKYYDSIQDSLGLCLRAAPAAVLPRARTGAAGAIVFGSDQGLVGHFNEAICARVLAAGAPYTVLWPVGERAAVLAEQQLPVRAFPLPASIDAVTALVGQLVVAIEAATRESGVTRVDVYHHRPDGASGYVPVCQPLLPLDDAWRRALLARPWPTRAIAQVLPAGDATLRACMREYLFVALFRACAASLASENAARLAAMQRAEKNIGESLEVLRQTFHRQRQGAIDDELFDLVAGFEAQQALVTKT